LYADDVLIRCEVRLALIFASYDLDLFGARQASMAAIVRHRTNVDERPAVKSTSAPSAVYGFLDVV